MSDRSVLNVLLGVLAISTLGIGTVLAAAPTVLPAAVIELVATVEQTVDAERALLVLGGLIGLFALWRAYFSGASGATDRGIGTAYEQNRPRTRVQNPRGDRVGDRPPTRTRGTASESPAVEVVGEEITERVDRTTRALKRGSAGPVRTEAVVKELRETLRAVEMAHGRTDGAGGADGVDETDERIRCGEWTDDRIAATFLGDESAGRLSIWHRFRNWLFPGRTFERRLDRTIAELERYATESAGSAATVGETSDARRAGGAVEDREPTGRKPDDAGGDSGEDTATPTEGTRA
ncbi:DUF7269 family protein [Natrialba asiatica]|uniref:Uncharacterized protein n=1 Tax=Natrialba asiatica (strain ATCC 700177 / DSM 12278 / JCM 9576 / FERM P-10747 / NBRC 102637 / 172P1) TaxID=29540 RepID=M0AJV9_NATA1|nr:hypothetical protein [Natrialba asiatica]ELY98187.1 hypothetical protein C481_19675 [Natrialba asiatica DSM 12278]